MMRLSYHWLMYPKVHGRGPSLRYLSSMELAYEACFKWWCCKKRGAVLKLFFRFLNFQVRPLCGVRDFLINSI